MSIRALCLMSGGLDSMLAVRVLLDQEIEAVAITFETPFFGPTRARMAANQLGVPLRVLDIGAAHLEMLKNPLYGYGRRMNPCIDCHALMLQTAGGIMEAEGYDLLCTGEVLGQRPMSQRRDALMAVDKLAGYGGLILRPLSAKLLQETIPEKEGKIDRGRLLDIQGRSRKRQIALAEKYGIEDYPGPGGGCLLTDAVFSSRLRNLFETLDTVELRDVELLKWGRHLRLPSGRRLVVGRIHKENLKIQELARSDDRLLIAEGIPGPTGLIDGETSAAEIQLAAEVVAAYSDADTGTEAVVMISGQDEGEIRVNTPSKKEFRNLLI